ncbi:peptidylprolyl isomerase [Tateyamaria sp.]|uniref:peptidylprolyl isomerase n=1 Tax=Tateyamaria sp. TaxID=1929288 RepID=UPI00329D6949
MRKTLTLLALLGATPALASGLDITVEGEANGVISIELFDDVAPQHVARIKQLAETGEYNGVAFHRVIDGFMAQTGDVQFGDTTDGYSAASAGRGKSSFDDLPAEFSDAPYKRGVVGMARSQSPNSANSQFFITFDEAPFLNGQYTVVGEVTSGLEVLDAIKRGHPRSGAIEGTPDVMSSVTVTE